jgi:hypothetical protein
VPGYECPFEHESDKDQGRNSNRSTAVAASEAQISAGEQAASDAAGDRPPTDKEVRGDALNTLQEVVADRRISVC